MKTLWPARLPAQRRCVQALEQAAAGALLAAAMVLAPTALAQQPGALGSGSIYTCIDSQGRKLTSDRPIGACIDREQRELGPSGTTVRRVLGPTLTDHERAAQEAQRRQAQEERSRVQEERRRDRVMLARYPDAATHNVERTAAVALLDEVSTAAAQRIIELRQQRKGLDQELEFYSGNPAKAPLKLRRQLAENDEGVLEQQRFLVSQEQEKRRVHQRFDAELAQLQKLWSQQRELANSSDGRDLRVLQEASLEAGSYQFEWDTTALAPGMYYVTLLVDGQPVVKKAVKVDR